MAINPVAAGGFASAADTYARIRPTYARAAIGVVKEWVGDGRVLDVAAGTGILTGQVRRSGVDVIAVEPVAPMLGHLVRTLPDVPALAGLAEALPLRSGSFGAMVVGEAFHWFDAPAALAEAARILEPGGVLGLLWNRRDDSVDWVARYDDAVMSERPEGRPYGHQSDWVSLFADSGRFTPVESFRFDNPRPCTPADLVGRAASISFVAAASTSRRDRVLERVADLALRHPDLAGRQRFEFPYVTELYLARSRTEIKSP